MIVRYSALARWSLSGVPSRPSASAAARAVSRFHGLPMSIASVSRARIGVAATPPRPIRASAHDAVVHVEREPDRDAGDVVEAALGDLVERREVGQGQRDADRPDELVRPADGLAVAGEVVAQRDLALTLGRREDDAGVEGEESGRGVADRRTGAEVAADGRAVADQPRGELREHLREQRDAAGEEALGLGERDARADLHELVGEVERQQLGDAVDRHDQRFAATPDVDLDAPVGRPRDDDRGGILGQHGERILERGRTHEPAVRAGEIGGDGLRRRSIAPQGDRVILFGGTERVRGVADRAVSGAPAEIPAERVQVEAVRTVLVVVAITGGFGPAVAAVELRRHAAHEAGGAVSALRAAAARHRILNRMQVHGRAEALRRDDLLPVERRDGDEAGVHGGPRRAAGGVGLCDEDRARAAFPLGAALFRARQPVVSQPVERRGVSRDRPQRAALPVDGEMYGHASEV